MVPRMGMVSMVWRMASVATWSDSLRSPWPMVRAERWPQFHHAQKSRSQIALDVLAETPDFAFGLGMSDHKALQKSRTETIARSRAEGKALGLSSCDSV